MKYKALVDIGEYKAGEEVPAEIAQVWAKMYKESPVQEVVTETAAQKAAREKAEKEAKKKAEEEAKKAEEANASN